jgi:hypothetical protein
MSFYAFNHTTHYVQPSTMAAPLPSFILLNYSFFFAKCSGIWSPFIPIFMRSLVQFFLSRWCKDPRSSTWGFLHLFGPNVSRVGGERGLVHTL